jgi:hypothetical protein
MWRFVAGSIAKTKIEVDKESYRVMKIRARLIKGDVNVSAILIEKPDKISDNVAMLEKPKELGKEWNMLENSLVWTNVTS